MNKNQFISYVENPDKLTSTDSLLLADLIKSFPFFQTAHLLYSKSLHNTESIHYNNQLKTTAAYATDRKMLHRLITKQTEEVIELVEETEIAAIIEDKKIEQAVHELVKEEIQEQAIQPIVESTNHEVEEIEIIEVPKAEIIEEIVINNIESALAVCKEKAYEFNKETNNPQIELANLSDKEGAKSVRVPPAMLLQASHWLLRGF